MREHYDVVIIGAGLAGLSLARQLILNTDKTILVIEKRAIIPPARQKVGEATVQLSGYYFSKVLDLEEHLLCEHFMKYNLRFFYKTAGGTNRSYEDYGQSYIRTFSNIASYQIDRNTLEKELLRLNRLSPQFAYRAPATELEVGLGDAEPHTVRFQCDGAAHHATAAWVVDTSGRGKFLQRQLGLMQGNAIRHGTSFIWVDGLLNVETLTDMTPQERRLWPGRAAVGHLPFWLATNHFVGEGYWLWVIPLHGKTSIGLVYDQTMIAHEDVSTPDKLVAWICREWPLFARDLPQRQIVSRGSFKDYSYGCKRTIHSAKWALSGESGRFADPLYSPGGDFIAVYNTLIMDAILTPDTDELASKCQLYELAMNSIYESLLPSFTTSYDALGDQEAFALKYTWELAIYFSFFVFPFINDLITDRQFILLYLSKFSRLGNLNKLLQAYFSAYYQWKKTARAPLPEPVFHDFTNVEALRKAEHTFYDIGVSVGEARHILDAQLDNLKELARLIVAHCTAVVLADERVISNRSFIESIDLQKIAFDPDAMEEAYAPHATAQESYLWAFDAHGLEAFRRTTHGTVTESAAD